MRVDGFAPGGSDRKRFEAALSSSYLLLWLVGVDTGLRIGDLLRIRVRDVHALCEGSSVTETKTNKTRSVKLTPTTAKALLSAISARDGHEYIWESPVIPGQPIARQSAWRAFKRAKQASGVKKSTSAPTRPVKRTLGASTSVPT
jgi:integrase